MRSSVRANDSNHDLKKDLITATRRIWQPRIGRELSQEDARQIAFNMTGFFSILSEWSKAGVPIAADHRSSVLESRELRPENKRDVIAITLKEERA